jgi:riboflavin kinase, archaea type
METMKGIIVGGRGEGAYFVEKYAALFKDALGFTPFFGTLNIEVKEIPELKNGKTITPDGKFKPVHCYKAKIRNDDVWVIRPEATHHPASIVEIIAPFNIKKAYGIKNGDEIECSLE